ncbi:aspartate-semialdehyde dehydrogenase [candidate division KSB3 bacterium]|uniref:aspartate-semialdehyde dehydrogenase n=1 Tax=candidate division KSB3 bacterium TaxID=2044937 RepID=A0A2G6E2B5_9BACT|nr:MAG: aspartate-semialdehyde dehydrogenase [candidate division KSB3 bacterium]PIE28645.1 MAG: aspartate-semialdehyde dehydrogenase [candidate division KSB3 bacterium]
MKKMGVGVLGATGMVGQNYIQLLESHPWFEVSYVAASPRSAGKSYTEAVAGRWVMKKEIPQSVAELTVGNANNIEEAQGKCQILFSAVELDKQAVRDLEEAYAGAGFPVVSNNSAHRHTPDVPMLIPEINSDHVNIINIQRKHRGWSTGLISVKPNCSLQSYMTPVYALIKAGYPVDSMIVTTLQAVSGAGYPGCSSLDMLDNIVPLIKGEEEKSELEPLKILGTIADGKIVDNASIKISAHCNRIAVIDGHTACVSLKFKEQKPSMAEIRDIWADFRGEPQDLDLPFAPRQPIIYRREADRPQPRRDRDADKGMAVSVGRLRECPVFDIRFVALSHNTVRGAAGGAILGAELLKAKGYIEIMNECA